jgi:diguanylate cyclase (GGDEF)-like protein
VAGELRLITRGITIRTAAEIGLVAIFNQGDQRVRTVSTWGVATDGEPGPAGSATGGFVGRVFESGRVTGARIDAERDRSLGRAASGALIGYGMGAPIRPPGGPPGALCIGFTARPPGASLALWQVESYARLAALCLHEAGSFDGLLAVAHVDGLTGCLNYTAVRAELDREIRRSERHGKPFSCCFIDLDHFKQVNDRHGHLVGNRVLAEVGAILLNGMRTGDTIARYGGDEFLAILPDAGEAAACALGERLRDRILSATPGGVGEQLDVSIGVAEWRPGTTAEEMLGAADAVLLAAKERGGGIVIGAGAVAVGAGGDRRGGVRRGPIDAKAGGMSRLGRAATPRA